MVQNDVGSWYVGLTGLVIYVCWVTLLQTLLFLVTIFLSLSVSQPSLSFFPFLSPMLPLHMSLPPLDGLQSQAILWGRSLLCCPHPSLVCVCMCTNHPWPLSFGLVCVCLCCVFPPSQGFGLLTLQTLSLITVHNNSLRALREDFISLWSSFLSFPLSLSTCFFPIFYSPSPPFLLPKLTR